MTTTTHASSLTVYQSPLFSAYANRLSHGFTGKPFTLGGRFRETVADNRQRLCALAGLDGSRLVVPNQVHSARSMTPDAPLDEADAVILPTPGIPALLLFADCTPVLLYDPEQQIGAVVHAGWRGTAQSIAAQTAQRLQRDFGCKQLIAAIGPAIGPCCYEVSDDVANALLATVPDNPPPVALSPQGRPMMDVPGINQRQLQACGVWAIDVLRHCTQCEADRLYSHRRGDWQRQGAYLQLR
jgi:YfiH family protein